jgi:UDP-GlcNAc:undecaprenyl-phosphate GlcNAc-1-phosphate transferase
LEFLLGFDSILMIAGSFVISLVTVALILKISRHMSWYDRTSERKVHTGDIPRLGGLGFAFSFIVCFAIISLRSNGFGLGLRFFPLILAFVLVLVSGVRDDFKPMSPRAKLVFQIGAALCVMASGYGFDRAVFIDGVDFLSLPGWKLLRYPLTLLWIVGMTNAINFIDGVDGLAGGISLLSALSFGLILGPPASGSATFLLCACLGSAILGFLVFNAPCPRAKIFMGDGGAYFLGFTLALFPLIKTGVDGLPIPYAAAVLLIPILDTTAAVWRRLRDGRRIDSPDRSHTHHKLMTLGFSFQRIDAALFALQICLSALVYLAIGIPGRRSLLVLLLAYAAGAGFFTAIHFLNRRKLKNSAPGPESP